NKTCLTPVVSAAPPVGSVSCPDGSSCPDSYTCCLLSSGAYGCCPYAQVRMTLFIFTGPTNVKVLCVCVYICMFMRLSSPFQAICCSDRIHCCPEGTDCDVVHSASLFKSVLPMLCLSVAVVTCNGTAVCADGNTCCKLPNGGWACSASPPPQAVCCEDHLHCCPHGTVCNLEASTCDDHSAGTATPWRAKIPASPAPAADGKCDELTSCPGKDTTCCFMGAARRWGCCPLPQAVCCEDGLHCCPGGHACEPHRSACSKGPLVVVPWFSKLSALSEPGAVTDVKCDDKSSCASGTTCCKLKTGEWGCCPLVKAVCCADREHCCPQGYTCNMETGTCEKTNRAGLPLPQVKVVRPDAGDVPCDAAGEFRCSERDTCCRVSASEWACCPSPRAVCCPGSRHCCPAGHSCDPAAAGCSQRSHHSQLTWDAPVGDGRRL
uniref:Granulin b n=1 Tax=Cyclopterus lumpus TaxID=8103 RepID=A0A8C2WIB1_CYCLU